jgi:hypothetical protein
LIGTHISPVCVDAKDVRDRLLRSKVIHSVPTVIVDTASGSSELYEGDNAIRWLNGAIESTIQQLPKGGGGGKGSHHPDPRTELQNRHEIEFRIRKKAYERGHDPDQAVKEYFGEEDDEDDEEEDDEMNDPRRPPPRGNPRSKDFMVGGQEDEGFLDINDPSAGGEYTSLGDKTTEEPDIRMPAKMKGKRGKSFTKGIAAQMEAERNEMVGRD